MEELLSLVDVLPKEQATSDYLLIESCGDTNEKLSSLGIYISKEHLEMVPTIAGKLLSSAQAKHLVSILQVKPAKAMVMFLKILGAETYTSVFLNKHGNNVQLMLDEYIPKQAMREEQQDANLDLFDSDEDEEPVIKVDTKQRTKEDTVSYQSISFDDDDEPPLDDMHEFDTIPEEYEFNERSLDNEEKAEPDYEEDTASVNQNFRQSENYYHEPPYRSENYYREPPHRANESYQNSRQGFDNSNVAQNTMLSEEVDRLCNSIDDYKSETNNQLEKTSDKVSEIYNKMNESQDSFEESKRFFVQSYTLLQDIAARLGMQVRADENVLTQEQIQAMVKELDTLSAISIKEVLLTTLSNFSTHEELRIGTEMLRKLFICIQKNNIER